MRISKNKVLILEFLLFVKTRLPHERKWTFQYEGIVFPSFQYEGIVFPISFPADFLSPCNSLITLSVEIRNLRRFHVSHMVIETLRVDRRNIDYSLYSTK